MAKQVLLIFAANTGFIMELAVGELHDFETGLYPYFESKDKEFWEKIKADKNFGKKAGTDGQSETTATAMKLLGQYTKEFKADRKQAAAE